MQLTHTVGRKRFPSTPNLKKYSAADANLGTCKMPTKKHHIVSIIYRPIPYSEITYYSFTGQGQVTCSPLQPPLTSIYQLRVLIHQQRGKMDLIGPAKGFKQL